MGGGLSGSNGDSVCGGGLSGCGCGGGCRRFLWMGG